MKLFSRSKAVMVLVNVWQWLCEVLFLIQFVVHLVFTHGKSKVFDQFWVVFVLFYFTILNGFYLLGDQRFQRSLRDHGFMKSFKSALLQNY